MTTYPVPEAVITEVTFFAGDRDDLDTYAIEVTWRGGNHYAVKRRSQVWNGTEWEWEPRPSEREDDFIARTRFPYELACEHAVDLVRAHLPSSSAQSEGDHE